MSAGRIGALRADGPCARWLCTVCAPDSADAASAPHIPRAPANRRRLLARARQAAAPSADALLPATAPLRASTSPPSPPAFVLSLAAAGTAPSATPSLPLHHCLVGSPVQPSDPMDLAEDEDSSPPHQVGCRRGRSDRCTPCRPPPALRATHSCSPPAHGSVSDIPHSPPHPHPPPPHHHPRRPLPPSATSCLPSAGPAHHPPAGRHACPAPPHMPHVSSTPPPHSSAQRPPYLVPPQLPQPGTWLHLQVPQRRCRSYGLVMGVQSPGGDAVRVVLSARVAQRDLDMSHSHLAASAAVPLPAADVPTPMRRAVGQFLRDSVTAPGLCPTPPHNSTTALHAAWLPLVHALADLPPPPRPPPRAGPRGDPRPPLAPPPPLHRHTAQASPSSAPARPYLHLPVPCPPADCPQTLLAVCPPPPPPACPDPPPLAGGGAAPGCVP